MQSTWIALVIHSSCLMYLGIAEMVELLLSKGSSLNIRDANGNIPLHLACKSGNVAIVKLLLRGSFDQQVTKGNDNNDLVEIDEFNS